MKYAKLLSLAAVAAFALMALAGAEIAAATQICKRVESGGEGKCRNGSFEKELAKGESFTASSIDLVLTGLTTYVTCPSSSVTLKMTSKNSIPLIKGKITALSFTDCKTSGGTGCVATAANLPYEVVLHKEDVIVFDEAGVVFKLHCGYLVSCELTAREQLLGVEGDLVVASEERPLSKKGFCPVVPRLDASYSTGSKITLSS